MALKINLSNHADKFASGSHEITLDKRVNFIFGKNGTGKTTIADEICAQMADRYDVRIFKDFEGIAENERLDAVALGKENAEIQKKIEKIDAVIVEIEKQTKQPEDGKVSNLFTLSAEAAKTSKVQDKKIKDFYASSASAIKRLTNPQVADTSYDTRGFQRDIEKAQDLSIEEISSHKNIIKSDKKADIAQIIFPSIDLTAYLESANEILQSCVAQPQIISELKDNSDKEDFAKKGMKIHERKIGEVCAFCGNEISDTRWKLLNNYFNDEFQALEKHINNGLEKIQTGVSLIDGIKDLEVSAFYDQFQKDAQNLNLQLVAKQREFKDFLDSLKTSLASKLKSPFSESDPINVTVPEGFAAIKEACDALVKSHNDLSLNLKTEQGKAKNALRYSEVKKKLDEFLLKNPHFATKMVAVLSKRLAATDELLMGKISELKRLKRSLSV